jgi:hypothetical protein
MLMFLYSYHPLDTARLIGIIVVSVTALLLYSAYRLIIWKMSAGIKACFNRFLTLAGTIILVLFFSEITLTLITQHQVNRQLGFNYATPETPEGELFLITRVITGKTMDRAGLMVHDRVRMWSVSKLYRLLTDNQGKEVEFSVLRDKNKIIIRVKVPVMDLPFRRVSFWL